MKSGFKDLTEIKKQEPKDHPQNGKKSPWDFHCPQYDERSSCFVNTGTHYGIGHKQPIGSKNHKNGYAVPVGKSNTMRIDEVG